MLRLALLNEPMEVRRCALTGDLIVHGDMYFHDDVDGIDILAREYYRLKRKRDKERFDFTRLNQAQSQKEYQEMLKAAQKEQLYSSILDREIIHNGVVLNQQLNLNNGGESNETS